MEDSAEQEQLSLQVAQQGAQLNQLTSPLQRLADQLAQVTLSLAALPPLPGTANSGV